MCVRISTIAIGARNGALALFLSALPALMVTPQGAIAQSSQRDRIADLITGSTATTDVHPRLVQSTPAAGRQDANNDAVPPAPEKDPREGDKDFEQARDLMRAIDSILRDTAENRSKANKLPSKDEFILTPLWTETREDRERRIRDLMDSALGIVTDVPIVDIQKRIEKLRRNIS
ncbi:MAG: hypothetical protein KKB37_12990, partial [Alphaproteobacteria bacterium]|nr:hypothetical protein [Alphaproteobacteria bacterium]